MGMNWGGFAGGLSQGFNSGLDIGNKIKGAKQEYDMNELRKQGIAEATAARDASVASSIKDNGDQAATQVTQPAQSTQAPSLAANPATADPQDQNRMIPQEMQGAPVTMPSAVPAPQATDGGAPPSGMSAATPAASGMTNAPPRYTIGGKGFATIEEARAHADKNKPSIMDFMGKTLVPKMQAAYLERGDTAKADAWGDWSKEQDSRKYMETWGKAFQAAQSGDYDTAADHIAKLHSDFDDGHTVVSREKIKDANGNVTGISLTTKDDKTGEKTTQVVDPKTLVEYGLGGLSPEKRFELAYKNKTSADAMGAKAAIDNQNDMRTAGRQEQADIRKDARQEKIDMRRAARESQADAKKHEYKLSEITTEKDLETKGIVGKERAKVQAKVDILTENGISREAIKELIPHMVGGDGYKKSTSPEEARRLLLNERIKDPMFSRKSAAEQKAVIDQDMQNVYGAPKSAPANPASSGMPGAPSAAAPAPAGKGKGTPYMKPDGSIVYR